MAMKKVGIYGVTGVIVAVLIVAGLMVSGIKIPWLYNKGTLIVKLTDAPVELEPLNVTITGLAVQNADGSGEDGGWISLPFVNGTTSVYVDILALQNVTQDLSVAELAAGNYTKLRMDISTANATYLAGGTVDLTVPPGHLDIIVHFEIATGETTTLLVDFIPHISETDNLSPVLKAIVV